MYRCLTAFSSFSITFSAYFMTLFKSIPGGDSGELIAEACEFGVAHPPGYPLFILLYGSYLRILKIGYWILYGNLNLVLDTAWFANFLSALLGSMSISLMSLTVYDTLSSSGISMNKEKEESTKLSCALYSVFVSVFFALSKEFWLYSIGTEVFALNNFLCALLIFQTVQVANNRSEYAQNMYIGAFSVGLGLSNQHTSILLSLPLIVFVCFVTLWRVNSVAEMFTILSKSFLSILLGVTPYSHLLITSALQPRHATWGDVGNLKGLWNHFIRKDYGTFKLYSGSNETDSFMERFWFYYDSVESNYLPFECLVVFSAFFLVGIVRSHKAILIKAFISWLFLSWCFYISVFFYLSNLPLEHGIMQGVFKRFFMQPNLTLLLPVSFSLHFVLSMIQPSNLMLATVSCLVLLNRFHTQYSIMDQSGNDYMEKYGRAVLSPIPQQSLLLDSFDQQWTAVRYLQVCQGFRGSRDDVLATHSGFLTYLWYSSKKDALFPYVKLPGILLISSGTPRFELSQGYSIKQFMDANMKSFPGGVYFSGTLPFGEDKDFKEKYETVPFGLLKRVLRKPNNAKSKSKLLKREEKLLRANYLAWEIIDRELGVPNFPPAEKYDKTTWESTIQIDYRNNLLKLNSGSVGLGSREDGELEFLIRGVESGETLLKYGGLQDNDNLHVTWKNTGIAYFNLLKRIQSLNHTQIQRVKEVIPQNQTAEDHILFVQRVHELYGRYVESETGKKDADFDAMRQTLQLTAKFAS